MESFDNYWKIKGGGPDVASDLLKLWTIALRFQPFKTMYEPASKTALNSRCRK